ncbi:MAG: hypothetical protein E6J65_29115 [Deltaproteobacteria bacterium]|nr:MAG: hypothetical protein E6J65_29115 [Deltaproteobacteria bacterium]
MNHPNVLTTRIRVAFSRATWNRSWTGSGEKFASSSIKPSQRCAHCRPSPGRAILRPFTAADMQQSGPSFRAGKRTAQRYTYSPRFPVLQFNETQQLFFGGNFWDGRSTGYLLQSADAEQAQHPPVDPLEHGNPDTACIAFKLAQSEYRTLFEDIWGKGSLDIIFPPDTEEICCTPGGAARFGTNPTPVRLSPEDRTKANRVYDNWGQSISFYESSNDVSPFTSKFDAFLKGSAPARQRTWSPCSPASATRISVYP